MNQLEGELRGSEIFSVRKNLNMRPHGGFARPVLMANSLDRPR